MLEHGELPLPAAVLVVSGGHTSLYFVPEPGRYELIGRTRDDAAGEAYDKVAKLLGLGYPGRPGHRSPRARRATIARIDLPAPRMTHADRNRRRRRRRRACCRRRSQRRVEFSFSGLKTAVMRLVQERQCRSRPASVPTDARTADAAEVADICASFQRVVVEALLDRTFEAARWLGARSIGIAGGVSANSRLRADAEARGARAGLPVFVPPLSLSTDNAAMIAAAGLRRLRARRDGRLGSERGGVARSIDSRSPSSQISNAMNVFTDYLWFNTKKRQEFIRITDEVAAIVKKSGVAGRDGAGVGDAHHVRRLRERLGETA